MYYSKPDQHGNLYSDSRRLISTDNNNSGCPRINQRPLSTQTNNRLKFESDYDFEKANEQFKETLESLGIKLERHKLEGIKVYF